MCDTREQAITQIRREVLHPTELLTENVALIARAVAFACRRYRFDPSEAEELASVVNLKLVDNDCAVLRAYEARCSFATFINIVVQRVALDYRVHTWGKWHTSAEAKRLGGLAVALEELLHRDGRTLDEALAILAPKHEGVTRESLRALAERLPPRMPRHRDVSLDEAGPVAVSRDDQVEERVLSRDRRRTSERLSTIMSALIAALPEEERLILQLRFQGTMTIAQIARSLHLDQKLLYRRLEHRMRDIRAELESSGFDPGDVVDLIGREDTILDFDLRNAAARPSIATDEKVAATPEGSR